MEARSVLLRLTLVLFLIHPVQTKPLVVVTLYPIASLVEELTGGAVEVYSITPKGVRVHTYIVTSEDIEKTREADAFIAIGAEEFLSQLPVPEGSLIIKDRFSEYDIRINESLGFHGFRFYTKDLIGLTRMLADYLGREFPRLNDTVHQNAQAYIERVEEFEESISEMPKGSVVASFPLIAYMCISFNVSYLGPIMPGGRKVVSDRPIVSFVESEGTPVDDAVRSVAEENGVPVFYVEAFSDDPLSELIKASSIIIGASTAIIREPRSESTRSCDRPLLIIMVIGLLYLALKDHARRIARRGAQKGRVQVVY